MRPRTLPVILLVFFSVVATPMRQAAAHDPGLSALTVVVDGPRITAGLQISASDLPSDPVQRAALLEAPISLTASGQDLELVEIRTTRFDDEYFRVELEVEIESEVETIERLGIQSNLLESLPFGHRQYLRVIDPRGASLHEVVLEVDHPSTDVSMDVARPRALSFVVLGFQHILVGWDHLTFLLVVLLGCHTSAQVLKVVTAFTLAHSATLVLSTVGGFHIAPTIVEPAIAASIVLATLHTLARRARERIGLTFGFGLIHGLGFAGQLAGLGLEGGGFEVVAPLLGFNLGVELGQLLVAAAIVPALMLMRRQGAFARLGPATLSVACGLIGFSWLVERLKLF